MHQTMRWYGPHDAVALSDLRQAGCEGVVTALHHIPYGEVWPIAEIEKRREMVEAAGMTWTVIESLPVHDDIKRQTGNWRQYIENYKTSLRHVAACGLKVVTYNFMPVLDWLRTDISYEMPDGSRALRFEKAAFAAFELFLLQRPGAACDYSPEEVETARRKLETMDEAARAKVFHNLLLGLPGSDDAFTPEQVLQELQKYAGIDANRLKQHLYDFLREVAPVAEECGLKLAIHPDDPPYPVLGLPRVVSTAQDLSDLLDAVPLHANGLCFCTGSLGARPDNDVPDMLRRFGDRIHFLHLRNTRRDADGNFFEADHLDGDTDMVAVMQEVLRIMQYQGVSIPMRPDHGHQMLDDLHKQTYAGYSAIGRLRGLAELRGLEAGLARALFG
ncbi:MAG: mannonate dehydratase [Bacteroidota bacterium]